MVVGVEVEVELLDEEVLDVGVVQEVEVGGGCPGVVEERLADTVRRGEERGPVRTVNCTQNSVPERSVLSSSHHRCTPPSVLS